MFELLPFVYVVWHEKVFKSLRCYVYFLKIYFHFNFQIWCCCPILHKVNIKYNHDLPYFTLISMVHLKNV
jgi:hypothetical protein